ncbi:F-box protein CPR1 [Camellia lanceoleosa]|uniref:F-box protein CPR1 n=1 Tax=Camellia lanceoleosa TaxID=1840588 RepID=A0ACC0F9K6_9ERIC|nr:F-box protein CPR1 [Camellia lanceoleosa]
MSSTAINSYPDGITLGYTERFASYLEGAVHFVANMKKSNDPLILSFDLSAEVFQTMMLPNGMVGVRAEISTSVFGGLLSLLCYEYTAVNKSCSIWIMKEYGVVDSWCKQFTVDLSGGIAQGDASDNPEKSYQYELVIYELNFVVPRSTHDQSTQARIETLITDTQRLHGEIDLQFEELNREIEVAYKTIARMGPQQHAEVYPKLQTIFSQIHPRDVSSNRRHLMHSYVPGKTKLDNFNYSMDSKHDLVDDITYDLSLPNGTTSEILILSRHIR